MRLDVATFGDAKGSHGLLGCSTENRDLFREIVNRTDRPGAVPPGVIWMPYLSGFAQKGYYFLTRTFPDERASRRGMVSTFAVAAPLADFCEIENLLPVVDALPADITGIVERAKQPLCISSAELTRRVRGRGIPPQLARSLLEAKMPAVWASPESFDEIVVGLWSVSWPSARKSLSFRLSFGPEDIDTERPPTLVTTPKQLSARWHQPSFIGGESDSLPLPLGAAVSVLTGDAKGEPLVKLSEELQTELTDLRQLVTLEALFAARSQAHQTFSSLRAQLQLAAKLSPDNGRGATFKSSLVDEISGAIPSQSKAAEIRGLRNLPWESLDPSQTERLLRAAAAWIRTNLVDNTLGGDSVAPLLRDALTENTRWALSVRMSMQDSLDRNNGRAARALWLWLTAELGPHFDKALEMYINNPVREAEVSDSCPNLTGDQALAGNVVEFSRELGWFELHAQTLLRSKPPAQAVADHLSSLPVTDTTGLDRLRRGIGPREFFVISSRLGDLRLVGASLACLSEFPDLWQTFDSKDRFWRELLTHALPVGPAAGLTGGILRGVMDKVVSSMDVISLEDETLIGRVAEFQADWSGFEVPEDAWQKVPTAYRRKVLGTTADGWLRMFLNGEIAPLSVADEIRTYLVEEARVRAALDLTRRATSSIALFERFRELSQELFSWWVGSVLPSCPAVLPASLRIGDLILERQWRHAAHELNRVAENRDDLRPALKVCAPLLGTLQRLRLFAVGVLTSRGEIDPWSALLELGLQLFSYGPGSEDLWSRAGGDPADLPNFRSGRESWATLISQARVGRHNVTTGSLTDAMLETYPNNPDLKRLAELIRDI